jgi:hypothetical protein
MKAIRPASSSMPLESTYPSAPTTPPSRTYTHVVASAALAALAAPATSAMVNRIIRRILNFELRRFDNLQQQFNAIAAVRMIIPSR